MTSLDDVTAVAPRADAGLFRPVAAPRSHEPVPRTLITPRPSDAVARRIAWERRFRARLRITDFAIILTVCVLASVISLSLIDPGILARDPLIVARLPVLTAIGWMVMLSLFNTRAPETFGSGSTEYTRVAHATALAFGGLALVFVVFQWDGLRAQVLFALPIGLFLLLLARWAWRQWLNARRVRGDFASRTLVVGERDDVEYVIRTLGPGGRLGYLVVGAALDDADVDALRVGSAVYPVLGTGQGAAQVAAALEADTIIVASRSHEDPDYVKRLAWQLEGTAAELILSGRLADVAGPRMSLRPVEGLPLLTVKIPTFEGGAHVIKRGLDIVTSAIALLLFAPFALLIAAAIKLDSPGPVFFRQLRVGRDGREFLMLKFRSMRMSAEGELAQLIDRNEGSGPLFKLRDDPRVTRVGRILRRYSLDEVPQFWNVLKGDMSVVGPRPPLPSEVTAYDGTVYRRLYIKPGITGPWQVGGRSDLSWEESVRLDLRYVENWSVMTDIMIMWQTVKVMVQPKGAY